MKHPGYGASIKRKENQYFSSSGKRQKTVMPRGPQGQGHDYQGEGQTRASSQPGLMICFHSHQPRHAR